MGNLNSAFTADIEDFQAIVTDGERPLHSSESRRLGTIRRSQSEVLLSSSFSDPPPPFSIVCDESERSELVEANLPDLRALKFLNVVDAKAADANPNPTPMPNPLTPSSDDGGHAGSGSGKSATPVSPSSPSPPSLFSGALSAVLHHPRAALRVVPSGSPALDQLRLQLHQMKEELELLKSQHKKEVKLLMSELDEEKRVRLSLQVDVEKIKKQLAKST